MHHRNMENYRLVTDYEAEALKSSEELKVLIGLGSIRLLLGIIVITFFIAACSSGEQKKWDRNWEGQIISPSGTKEEPNYP